jgi:hypothetical protein
MTHPDLPPLSDVMLLPSTFAKKLFCTFTTPIAAPMATVVAPAMPPATATITD